MQANMGMVGEFRCVVKRADGSTKIDTGYQKNLILNNGLNHLGKSAGTPNDMMHGCVIGSGNSQPSYTQNSLDAAIAVTGLYSESTPKTSYNPTVDGNLYKTNRLVMYRFTNLQNVNISELGLVSDYSSSTNYNLCTRALIKDSNGNPTTITILRGEILDIYYKLWRVIDISDKNFVINVQDGVGNLTPYNVKIRPFFVGKAMSSSSSEKGNATVGYTVTSGATYGFYDRPIVDTGDLVEITSDFNTNSWVDGASKAWSPYVNDSYKTTMTINAPVTGLNLNIRRMSLANPFGLYQIRFGRVSDDAPLTKTSTQTLSFPIEFSWGRYEGAL